MAVFDVAIVGAGPAGASAAILCAQNGLSVVCFDAAVAKCDRSRIETLNARVLRQLSKMSVAWPIEGAVACAGTITRWGAVTDASLPPIFSAYGSDWHVERNLLRVALLERASILGVSFRRRRVATRLSRIGSCWQIDQDVDVDQASFLIMATGRQRGPSVTRVERLVADRLVAHIGTLQVAGSARIDRRLVIATTEHGWWYACATHSNRVQLVLVTNAAGWHAKTDAASAIESVIAQDPVLDQYIGNSLIDKFTTAADHSVRWPVTGQDWIAIGDAALAFDPLSGQGVLHALDSAETASQSAMATGASRDAILTNYARVIKAKFDKSYAMSRDLYAQAADHHDSTFWMHRRRLHADESGSPISEREHSQ